MSSRQPSASDGRCLKNRTSRNPWHCTVCGNRLPDKHKDWGLVWTNEEFGACVACVHSLRITFGFRYAIDLEGLFILYTEAQEKKE
jgi:hypothetical protein